MQETEDEKERHHIVINYDKWLPKKFIKKEALEALKESLTFGNPLYYQLKSMGHSTEGVDPDLKLWRERMDYLIIPREVEIDNNFWIENKAPPLRISRPHGVLPQPFPNHNIKLRQNQIGPYNAFLKEKKGILNLSCGLGKTVIALAVAQALGLPTLIVVNTEVLMRQWKASILQFFPSLSEAHIGHVQQEICKFESYPFTVAMLHTLAKRKYGHTFYRYFGLIIYDEVHNLSTHVFKTVCNKFYGMRLGLSASTERPDKLDIVFKSHIGDVIYKDLSQQLRPEIYFIKTGVGLSSLKGASRIYNSRTDQLNWGFLYTALGRSESFNNLILEYATKAIIKHRKILLLGERIEQLKILSERFSEMNPDISCGLVIGRLSSEERERSLEKRAVFATARLAEEGLDCPEFDTLFVLYPKGTKKSIQQAVGRILRKHEGGKERPVALVFVHDGFSALSAIANKVKRNLKELGYAYYD